jgi:dipeptidyl aminopeptidase/acylaminoacyl peptidase
MFKVLKYINMKKTGLVLILTIISLSAFSQKQPLDSSSYDGWKNIGTQIISENGQWVVYTINPQQGDGWLHLYNVAENLHDSVAYGARPVFSPDSKYIAYQVIPKYAVTRQAKRKKLKEDKMPKNDLEVRVLPGSETKRIARVKSFELPEKNSQWMAYLLEKKAEEKKETKASADTSKKNTPSAAKKPKTAEPKGTGFVIYNPLTAKEYSFNDVTEFVVAKDGRTISYLQSLPDTTKIENYLVNVFDVKNETSKVIFEGKGSVKKLTTDRSGSSISFLFSADTAKVKVYDLYLSKNLEKASKTVDLTSQAMIKGWTVSENANFSFSDDGTRLYFGTARKPVKEPLDTLLEDEKYKLDIWSWDEDLLQPMQKKQLEQEKKRTWQAVYHLDNGSMFQLADTLVPNLRTFGKGNNTLGLGSSDLKYNRESSWEGDSPSDYYLVNIETGKRTLLFEKCSGRAMLSPSCKYFVYWDNKEKGWFSLPVDGGQPTNLTSGIKVPLYDELNDLPDDPAPHGIAGWMDDERHLLVYDRYDIWMLDLQGSEPAVNLSNNYGRTNNCRLRYLKLDDEADFIGKKELLYLSAFNYYTKEAGFFTLKSGKANDPVKILMEKCSYGRGIMKAKKADKILWNRGTFREYPELWVSDMNFSNSRKISVTNPQQGKYNWVTVDLVEWTSFDNQKLQGLLFKPEDFDPSKKYPMIVYFYERSSDELYTYGAPAPSASIINKTFAASNGYLVFVPDIPYKIGYPGQSCYNSVISGTTSLLNRYNFIDRNRLALDGQSWGGYQIAWLVTQTDLFACAYAGAAVSNMTSAYGGIRWESGMSRMFQYEHTQSRIGGTLWDKPIQFIENSPIFFVPKINTPLLLMHNDADGAVPWYQGIEFITALRRLNKPAWLLSYNDEAHNLVRRANRKDISIRKMQFFDHYLKDAPMPYWMKYGISQVEKGKIDGYDLVKE